MAVRSWPVMPKDWACNGLGNIEKQMIDDPDAEFIVISRVNRRRATIDDDSGDTVPTMRTLVIEPLTGDLEAEGEKLLNAAQLARCGEPQKPPTPAGMFDEHGNPLEGDGE